MRPAGSGRRLVAMSGASVFIRRYGLDVLIVLAAVAAAGEVAAGAAGPRGPQSPLWFALPAVVAVVLPLLARRRFPFAAPAALWVLAALISFIDGRLIVSANGVYVAGTLASYLLGNLRDAVQARIGFAVVLFGALIVVYNDPRHTPGEFVFIPLFFVTAWLAGFAVRERAAQAEAAEERAAAAEREREAAEREREAAEREQEAAARVAVAEERTRIARELHDVVAHAVSVMVLQVGAVRHGLPATLEEDREALGRVEQAGRTALAEMRRLLGAMRRQDDVLELAPQPGLDGLEALVEAVGRAGLPVRLHVDGEAVPLPRAIDLSAYRIVQEGLTNALKHARADHADVHVSYGRDDLRIEVRDDGVGGSANGGAGHGLIGVRERVTIYGGEMDAGSPPEGGFVLSVRLPVGGDER
jgi:signal transduction histidine kinase